MKYPAPFLALVLIVLGTSLDSARAQSCQDDSVEAAVSHAGQLTTLLQIANFRGDLKYMTEVAGELEIYLGTCGDGDAGRLPLICGYDCHLQLARQRLFLASDLPLLSTAGTLNREGPLSPQDAQARGNEGIAIVERGLKYLARQQAGGGDSEESSYRSFVHQLVGLNQTKVRLYMSAGDTWYQTMSEARIKALDFAITEVVEAVPGASLQAQPNLHKAHTQYKAALWTLIEIQMDIPDEQTYDDLRADLALLQNDLQARMDSVRRGHLFLNIDPYEFTTIPFEELQLRLQNTQRRLAGVENSIEQIVREWAATQQGEQFRQLDESRIIRSQQVNLIAHKIGKMEKEAQIFANEIQAEINALGPEMDSFSFRQQIRSLEIELATKIAEFENRRAQVEGRQELDLLVLEKEAQIERRNELRWLLSFEMTRMNLDLQISSLESQIDEYGRQRDRNQNQLAQLAERRAILGQRIEGNRAAIEQAERDIEEINIRSGEIYRQSRVVQRENICNVEAQLAFIGEPPAQPFMPGDGETPCDVPTPAFTRQSYFQTMCETGGGLRNKILDQQIQARAFVMQCVIGEADADFAVLSEMVGNDQILVEANGNLASELAAVDCTGFSDAEIAMAQQIYNSEIEMLDQKVIDLEEQRDEIDAQIKHVEDWVGTFTNTIVGLQVGLAVVEGTYAALASVPETTVAAAGMASGVYTTIKFDKPVFAVMEGLRFALDQTLKIGKINVDTEQKIKALGRTLTQIRQANAQIDPQKALKSLALHRTHFQLAGRRAQGREDIKELVLQSSIAAVDCANQDLGIDEQVARLGSEHTRLIASMELQAQENDLARFQIAAQEALIERFEREIRILELEIETVRLTEEQLTSDTARIDELIGAVEGRIERVERTRGTVQELSDESLRVTNAINELRERQGARMLALSEQELAFVESRIRGESANTESLVAALDQAVDLVVKNNALKENIRAFQGETLRDVAEQQEQITALINQIDDADQTRALFIANQETLSELLRGIPDYIDRKRRNLAVANRLLHMMRQRYATVLAATGAVPDFPSTVVQNGAQLDELVEAIAIDRFFNETQVFISEAHIVIPANSGFAKRLALSEVAEFEISPFAATRQVMDDSGYFIIWNPEKMHDRRNMTLVDVVIGAATRCTGQQWNQYRLEHLGSGSVFRPLAEGSDEIVADISIGPPRGINRTFYDFSGNGQANVTQIVDFWLNNILLVRKFPPQAGVPDNINAVFPFLGAPVIGSYRLSLLPSDCAFDGAVFTVYFIFSSNV